jgi:predicted phage-related endonuclease
MPIEKHRIVDRGQWLAMRLADLTASDVAAAVGRSPWKTQLALYAEKTGLIDMPPAGPMARRGLWLEPAVIAAVQSEHPEWEVIRHNQYFRDPELRLGATPDAELEIGPDVANLQLKVVAKPEHDKHWVEGPPLHYQLQALTEGLLTEADYSIIAALVISTYGADLFTYRVDRHPAAEQRIRDIATGFWTNVAAGVRPAASAASDVDILQQIYPESVAEPVLDLSGDNRLPLLLAARTDLKAQVKQAKDALETLDTEIKDRLGDAEKAELNGWKISWKTIHTAERLIPAGSFRRLTVTQLKGEDE